MSGIDEQRTNLIPIPEGNYAGRVPEYWGIRVGTNKLIGWLRQSANNVDFPSDFILKSGVIHPDEWFNEMYDRITGVESLMPYGYVSRDQQFVQLIVDELKKVANRMGICTN